MNLPDGYNLTSLTAENVKLDSFANRIIPTSIFIKSMHNLSNKIIFYYGTGGNGKSWLVRYLNSQFCKLLKNEEWEKIKLLDDASIRNTVLSCSVENKSKSGLLNVFKQQTAQSVGFPSVLMDFDETTIDLHPQNPFSASCYMRKELAGYGLTFFLFDYAYILYMTQSGNFKESEIKSVICDGAVDVLLTLAQMSSDLIPGSGLLLKLLHRIIGSKLYLYFKSKNIDERFLSQLREIRSSSELEKWMPFLLAHDLVASMQLEDAPQRIALFFDTYEKFWVTQRDLSPFEYFRKDEWFRVMLNVLQNSDRIITVVAGREPPRWSQTNRNAIQENMFTTHPVGLISFNDARESLEKKNIRDTALQDAIIRFTEVEHGEVHPMYLGICADAVIQRTNTGVEVYPEEFKLVVEPERLGEEVLCRLLSDVSGTLQPTIVALSVCRSFNYDTYQELVRKCFAGDCSKPIFDQILTTFSFVKKLSGENFQIHNLVRKLIERIPDFSSEIKRAKEILESYYRTKAREGSPGLLTEAIYFSNQLNPERGEKEWLETFSQALAKCDWLLCDRLSDLSQDFTFVDGIGLAKAKHLQGRFFQLCSRHSDAEASYLGALEQIESLAMEERTTEVLELHFYILSALADLLCFLFRHEKVDEYFQKALEAYNVVIINPPFNAAVHSKKGSLLNSYGYYKVRASESKAAERYYDDGIAACELAIDFDPTSADGYIQKAKLLCRMGDIKSYLWKSDFHMGIADTALKLVERAIELDPNTADHHCEKARVLSCMGMALASSGDLIAANYTFTDALSSADHALKLAPNSEYLLFSKAVILNSMVDSIYEGHNIEEVEPTLNTVVAILKKSLLIAPQNSWVHTRISTVLQRIGGLRMQNNKYSEAILFYKSALHNIDNALEVSTSDMWMWNTKGSIQESIGNAFIQLNDSESAGENLNKARNIYEHVIANTPKFTLAHVNLGDTLRALTRIIEDSESLKILQLALQSYDRALTCDSHNLSALFGKGVVYLDMRETKSESPKEEFDYLRQAIECFDEALIIDPNQLGPLSHKGYSLLVLAILHQNQNQFEDAETLYMEAYQAYRKILLLDPEDETAKSNIVIIINKTKGTKFENILNAQIKRDSVKAHDLKNEKRYRKPLDLKLSTLEGEEADIFYEDIGVAQLSKISASATTLPFLKNFKFVQFIDSSTGTQIIHYYLYKPGYAMLLNWTFAPFTAEEIHESFSLNSSNITDYVKFFIYFNRQSNAELIVVESDDDIIWKTEESKEDRTNISSLIKPIALTDENDDGFLLNGTVLINDTLCEIDMLVSKNTVETLSQLDRQNYTFPEYHMLPIKEHILCSDLKIETCPGSDSFFMNVFKQMREATPPHDLQDEARYRVPLNLGLNPVGEEASTQFLSDIFAPTSQTLSEVHSAKLSFFNGYDLYRYTDKSTRPFSIYYYLYAPGKPVLLNWINQPIYSLSSPGTLILTSESVIDYVKFFFYFVRADLGTFIVCEKSDDLIWLPESTIEEKEETEKLLIPLSYNGMDEFKRHVLTATVVFKDALFKTDIFVATEDVVIFMPDSKEEIEMSRGELLLSNEELLREEQNMPIQPPPHSEKERKLTAEHERNTIDFDKLGGPERQLSEEFVFISADENKKTRFLEEIYAPTSPDSSSVDVADLSFFKRRKLYRYTDIRPDQAVSYYYLYKPGNPRILNGMIESVTGPGDDFQFDELTVLSYLRLYCYFVVGDNATYTIIENSDNIIFDSNLDKLQVDAIKSKIVPLEYLGIDEEFHRVKCTVLVNDILFIQEFRIANSSVSIINPDTLLPMDLVQGTVIPENELLLAKGVKLALSKASSNKN